MFSHGENMNFTEYDSDGNRYSIEIWTEVTQLDGMYLERSGRVVSDPIQCTVNVDVDKPITHIDCEITVKA